MEETIFHSVIATPLGDMAAYAVSGGVVIFRNAARKDLGEFVARKLACFGGTVRDEKNGHLRRLEQEIGEYFAGTRKMFSVPVVLSGTPFQVKAWEVLRTIPYGQTLCYSEQARQTGNPRAVRAVGQANGRNALEILVPCHRVVGKNGVLTGFAGGIDRKARLLELERTCKPE